jgi:hypothetical protein
MMILTLATSFLQTPGSKSFAIGPAGAGKRPLSVLDARHLRRLGTYQFSRTKCSAQPQVHQQPDGVANVELKPDVYPWQVKVIGDAAAHLVFLLFIPACRKAAVL